MPTRAFIAYDFAILEGTDFSDILNHAKEKSPKELEITMPGDKGESRQQGTIWGDYVKQYIDAADKVIAFVDLPNANVGFEIGYALGLEKEVGVFRFKDTEHAWQKRHPLKALFRHQLTSGKDIVTALTSDKLIELAGKPSGGDGVLVLCPETGEAYVEEINTQPGWRVDLKNEWTLDQTLLDQLKGIGAVVWIITPHRGGAEERDGNENTCLSILAGYAEARPELDLYVFKHSNHRTVADLALKATDFADTASIRSHLTALAAEWSAKVAARKAPVVPAVPVTAAVPPAGMRPLSFPPLPPDHFAKTGHLFIGRQSELGTGADMVQGLLARFRKTGGTSGTAGIRLLWVHGFGGMGKSWYLHRIRLLGESQFPDIRSLVIDWDKAESRAPLADIPRAASEVYDLLAVRLCQRFGAEAANAYWEAKQRVAARHTEHQREWKSLRAECDRACAEDTPRLDPLLADILKGEGFWSDEKTARTKKIGLLGDDVIRYKGVLASWCHAKGETEQAICAPDQELAEGLRQSIRLAMANHPLIFLLDTCEVLLPVVDHALRQLFAPLLHESAPLLILVGSRLRADIHQPRGGKRGWRVEIPQETFSPLDFGEDRRFTTVEIEGALGTLTRPFTGDVSAVAARLHVATLGIPLAVRGLLDLHEQGDDVLSQLGDDSATQQPLGEKSQIRQVIGMVAERFLLNLTGRPEREDDLRDIVALSLVPRFDSALFARFWGVADTHGRITRLALRYSLLSDGDLHAVVRSYLRLHWREEKPRPECFAAVLSDLECVAQDSHHPPQPGDQAARLATLAAELNLRSWATSSRVVDSIARALTLALVYEVDTADLTSLLRELPPADGGSAEQRNLWHRDGDEAPTEREIVPWLKLRRAASREWSAEETAALALLEGITTAGRGVEPAVAFTALESLEKAVTHFGLDTLPRKASAGEAFFDCGHSLDPNGLKKADWVASSASAYERAIALHHLESSACNNVANLYKDHLNRPEEAEAAYREAIRLDPKVAHPHNGLGNLYQDHLNRLEEAEAAYREAIRLDPKYAHPHNGLGILYQFHLNRPEEAEAAYREAIRLDPKYANPHNGLGTLYQSNLNRPEEAEAAYREAIRLDPKFAHPHSGLGSLYEEVGRWGEAEVEFRQGVALDPKSAGGQRGLAWVALLARGDVTAAREFSEVAMNVDASHPGSPLAELAVEAWAGEWPEVSVAFAKWVRELPACWEILPRASRNRLAALLRKAREAGHLAAMAEPILAAVGRAGWQPWAEALAAVLAGRDATGLSAKAAELHARLSKPPTLQAS